MNIINKTPIMEGNSLIAVITGVIAISMMIVTAVMWIVHMKRGHTGIDEFSTGIVITWMILIIVVVIMACVSALCKIESGRYTYECTFNSINDFTEALDNYNFIEYRDGLFIMEDKP